jgi:hypothetical protein
MQKVEENMSFDSLHLIWDDPGAVDYFDLPEVERERYDQFISQLYSTQGGRICHASQSPEHIYIMVALISYDRNT